MQRPWVGTGFDSHAMRWISSSLDAFLQPVIPAFRVTDPDGALDEVRGVQILHGEGGCLRQPLQELPATPRSSPTVSMPRSTRQPCGPSASI